MGATRRSHRAHGLSGRLRELAWVGITEIRVVERSLIMAKTWFVTGASRGMGRELVEQLLAGGDRVAATLRRPGRLDDLAAEYGDRLWVRSLDVTDTVRLRAVVDEAFTAHDRIDVVVSNAGYGVFAVAEDLTDEQIDQMIETNLTGSIQLARAVVPHLRAQGGGHLMQMSSMGGQITFPAFSMYHVTKWGIEGFYDALAIPVSKLYGTLGVFGSIPSVVAFHVAFGLPFAIFLLRNFFAGIPRDLLEAARMDGGKEWTIFIKVIFPLGGPAIASLAIFQFLWVWNDMLVSLVFANTGSQPMTKWLQSQMRQFTGNIDILAPGAFLSLVVPLVVFFAFQRYFVQGVLAGSVK